MMFVQSLNQAAIPQIMKSQSANNSQRSLTLIYGIAKVAFFIMLIPTIPLIINMDYILKIWLKDVPPYTGTFAALLLIGGLIRCMGAGFDSSIQTTGKIRANQIFYSIIYLSILPIAYALYSIGFPVYTIIICTILAAIGVLVFQVVYLNKITEFDIKYYLSHTVVRCLVVAICSSPLFLFKLFINDSVHWFIISSIISVIWIILMIFKFGCTHSEKDMIKEVICRILNKIKK